MAWFFPVISRMRFLLFYGLTVRIAILDGRIRKIPNRLLLFGICGILVADILLQVAESGFRFGIPLRSYGAAAILFLGLFSVSLFTDSLGGGDAKLAFFVGLYQGENAIYSIGLSFVLAAICLLFRRSFGSPLRSRLRSVPMAPFVLFSVWSVDLFCILSYCGIL